MHTPLEKFTQWLDDATRHAGIKEPTAMTLATATSAGVPSARIVLLKAHGPEGFLFYTNHTSRKSNEIKQNHHAALCFYWMPLDRQVRIEGSITAASDVEADAYFAGRPRERQIGAWASLQSQALASRETLDARVAEMNETFKGRDVPRPPHWSGWRLAPTSIEFWEQSEARLHEREIYRLQNGAWQHSLLYP